MKIAIVAPWPPQKTGIADNIFDLVIELRNFFDIDIITSAKSPIKLDSVNILNYQNKDIDYKIYNAIIYEIGNNYEFHGYMMPLLSKYKGIIHLHDFVLQHFMAAYCYEKSSTSYYELLEKWYGKKIKDYVELLQTDHNINFWETNEVSLLPLYEEILQDSNHTLVHSKHSYKKIKQLFPNKPISLVEHFPFENIKFTNPQNSDIFKIGIFGGVQKNRCIDKIINTLKNISKIKWQLHIVGSIDEDQKYLIDENKECANIIFHDRLGDSDFTAIMEMMDLCISLRYPTMGETSGVVIRYIQMAIPTVVSNTWWYKELPDFVKKVSVENTEEELYSALNELLDKQRLEKIKEQMKNYTRNTYNKKIVTQQYVKEILKYILTTKQDLNESSYARQLHDKLQALNMDTDMDFIDNILNNKAFLFKKQQ